MSNWDLSKEGIEARYTAINQEGLGSIEKRAQSLMLDLAFNASRRQATYEAALASLGTRGTSWDTLGNLVSANAELRVSLRISNYLENAHDKALDSGKTMGGIEEVLVLKRAVHRAMETLSLGTSTSGISNELDRAEAKVWLDLNSRLNRHYED